MSKDTRVGLLLLVAAVIIVVAIFLVGDEEGVWKRKYELKIYYDDVVGLLTGAPVRLAGLRVGTVSKIEFSETMPGKLEVTVRINKAVMRKIRKDSKAFIGTMGLLGDKTIEITIGSLDSPVLGEGEVIKAGRALSIENILTEGGDLVDNIREASRHAREVLEKINKGTGTLGLFVNDPDIYFDLDRLLLLTEKLTRELEAGTGSFARFINDSTFYSELTRFLVSTRTLVDTLSQGEGTLPQLLNDPAPYHDLQAIVNDWREITDQIRSGEGSAGKLLTDDSLYISLTRTLDRTEALLKDFRENPGRYIKFRIF
ncbi:MAG: MCE family protein [candidate division Zixibacteria bacterium]|nr:MCE family protein [candidate division Zixibacteria bacterium]